MEFQESHILPTVRIQKIEIINFKSVSYGEVLFNCGRKVVPQDTEADILGIYGQNGSGKTSVIEAIAILERAMKGETIPAKYSECISAGAEYAKLTFVFDFQYPQKDGIRTKTISYSFKIRSIPNEKNDDIDERKAMEDKFYLSSYYPKKVVIYDEVISAAGEFLDGVQIKQDILTTGGDGYPIGPTRKIKYYLGENKEAFVVDLSVNKRAAAKDSKSFIFMEETMEIFYNNADYSEYFQILMELKHFARLYLYSVDTRASSGGLSYIPLNTRFGLLRLNLLGVTRMGQDIFDDLMYYVDGINTVLPSLIPDMMINVDHSDYVSENIRGQEIKLFSKRKDTVIPLRDESAGVIKLISVLSLIIAAFNDRSITVAIDELDAGIYEYLLGEILSSLEAYGKGQLIFTSHNLRPLEVLKKENLIFTTANPNNRYIRLKGVGRTNNLRNLYLREILGSSQDEQIYNAAQRQRMIAAFLKVGVCIAEKE